LLKKALLTSQDVALHAEQLTNKETVTVAVATAASNNVKCMMQLVQHVAFKHKFLSVQVVIVLFIAEIALARTARMSESLSMTGTFFIFL
jgi:hypothetical protein